MAQPFTLLLPGLICFMQMNQVIPTICHGCNTDQDCSGRYCLSSQQYVICKYRTDLFFREHCCVCTSETCSSDSDCSTHTCRSGYVSKCNSNHQCHCSLRNHCSTVSDCANHTCLHGYQVTCSQHTCTCQRATHVSTCSSDGDCSDNVCARRTVPYCRTVLLDGQCDCTECRLDSDCHQVCRHGYTRKCLRNTCECSHDGVSTHCSKNSECASHHCTSGYTSVCSLSSHSCKCEPICNNHTDCAHMLCHRADPVCMPAQNNSKTCICKTSCSQHNECANHRCSSFYRPICNSGQCICRHRCTGDSYCSIHFHCSRGKKPHCSSYLGNACVCEECAYDTECSRLQCASGYSAKCANNTCACKANPVDGGWSNWGPWSFCSVTCGSGNQTRVRSCTHPAPIHGGKTCTGDSVRINQCNNNSCQVDGGWSSWMPWSTCSVSCGSGVQTRAHSCNNPTPINGGRNCVGDLYTTRTCATVPCTGLVCPTCDENLSCTFNNTCDATETCMIRSYHHTKFTVHCSKKEDCSFEKSILPTSEIFCCDDRDCIRRYLGV
ncbi:SCO-spondin-like [Ostrea edulis]|uniref:SCO-spondin-like n=1 Tax=Ostrea edulis TaxID=37623 RepID=UPI002094D04C|nr:SCO-spondin-like [Ostrea edulis]